MFTKHFDGALADRIDGTSTVFTIAQDIIAAGVDMIRDAGCSHRTEIVKSAKLAYRTHVRPIDIPGVPNFIEGRVDDQIENIIGIILEKAFDSLCEDEDNINS